MYGTVYPRFYFHFARSSVGIPIHVEFCTDGFSYFFARSLKEEQEIQGSLITVFLLPKLFFFSSNTESKLKKQIFREKIRVL